MKQLISYYRMSGDREETIQKLVKDAGLDGVESLVYGTKAEENPFTQVTVGAHLKFWPCWLDFYEGNQVWLERMYPEQEKRRKVYGALDRDGWVSVIRKNIQAALAEKPRYLVWHVQDCATEEAFTWHFHHDDWEVLRCTASLYQEVKEIIPDGVRVLFENIFWPGLYKLEPEKLDYFFTRLDDAAHTGLMFDSGHYMITNPYLQTEGEAARYIEKMVKSLGDMRTLVKGIHLSCSLSGAYIRHFPRIVPKTLTDEVIMKHISSLDHHDPFQTRAAREIVELIEPDYVTHELFGDTFVEALEKARKQAALVRGG